MKPARASALILWTLLALWPSAAPAGARLGFWVSGRVLAPDGAGAAGAVLSDGRDAVATRSDGSFRLSSASGRVLTLTAPPGYLPRGKWHEPSDRAARGELVFRLRARPPRPEPLLALLSDPHLMDPANPPMRYPPLPGFLERPMRVWKNLAARLTNLSPDLTLVTGDLCFDGEKGGPGRLEGQTALAARAMAMLPAPARALPGNHDARYDNGAADYAVWRARLGPTRQLFRLPGLAVLLLDNNALGRAPDGRPRNRGRLPAEALDWMEAVLALLPPETHLIVAGHFPLVSPLAGSNPLLYNPLVRSLTGRGRLALRGADQSAGLIAGLIRRRPVLAVINGHEHAYQNSTLHARGRDFFFLGLPALCGAWWTGDRSFGPLNFAPGYLLTRIRNLPDRPRLDSKFVEVKF